MDSVTEEFVKTVDETVRVMQDHANIIKAMSEEKIRLTTVLKEIDTRLSNLVSVPKTS